MVEDFHRFCLGPLAAAALLVGCAEPKFAPPDDDGAVAVEGSDAGKPAADGGRGPKTPVDANTPRPDAQTSGQDARTERPPGDAGANGSDARAEVPIEAGVPGTPACLGGIFALRAEIDVSWNATDIGNVFILVRAGTGKVVIYARVEFEGTLDPFPAKVRICGTELPDFAGGDRVVIDERYGFYIPDAAWDESTMPRYDLLFRRECEQPKPGCRLSTLAPLVGTFGAAAFLEPPTPLMFLDHDNDTTPGITVKARIAPDRTADDKPYLPVPLSFGTNSRSDTLFAAFHIATGFDGSVVECGEVAGALSAPRIAIRPAGCRAKEDNLPERNCNTDETSFLATNVPPINAKSGTFEAYRIPNDSSCGDVRAYFAK